MDTAAYFPLFTHWSEYKPVGFRDITRYTNGERSGCRGSSVQLPVSDAETAGLGTIGTKV